MKVRVLCLVAAVMMASVASAGTFLAYVQMADGSVLTFELPSAPTPDSAGMFRFHDKSGGDIIVHASHVWFVEKSARQIKTKK